MSYQEDVEELKTGVGFGLAMLELRRLREEQEALRCKVDGLSRAAESLEKKVRAMVHQGQPRRCWSVDAEHVLLVDYRGGVDLIRLEREPPAPIAVD